MKHILVLLCLLFSITGLAGVVGSGLEKTLDGKSILCNSRNDDARVGYRPNIFNLQMVGTNLQFDIGVTSVVCAFPKGATKGTWDVRKFGDSYENPKSADVRGTVFVSDLKFLVINDYSKVIGTIDTDPNAYLQQLQYLFGTDTFLTAAEQKRLDAGQTIYRRFEFFLQGSYTIQTATESSCVPAMRPARTQLRS